jgi:predicted Rossmann fold flavoprotein
MEDEPSIRTFDAVIIGGGAAGLLCAIEAGKRGRRVAVIEHSERCGKKILISGGGRCNFTNIHCTPENFISANPHFLKSALARYTPSDFIALVEKYGIRYHEKKLGQLFCDHSAREILAMLESECRAAGVRMLTNCRVRRVGHDTGFAIDTSRGSFRAPAVVIASGGLSIPKIGATSFGYEVAKQFHMKICKTRPGLVPLVLDQTDRARYCDLAGVSAEGTVTAGGQRFREHFLITHKGLSGPAILQISSYWQPGETIHMDLAPGVDVTEPVRQGRIRSDAAVRAAFSGLLPARLATRWFDLHTARSWNKEALTAFEAAVHNWELRPADTEGYEKAEVTAGGVDTKELSSKSMESLKVPGLFFVGEVVDVTGHLGGFNFQWAWSSGAAAGRAL